jgi:hypothetical protein
VLPVVFRKKKKLRTAAANRLRPCTRWRENAAEAAEKLVSKDKRLTHASGTAVRGVKSGRIAVLALIQSSETDYVSSKSGNSEKPTNPNKSNVNVLKTYHKKRARSGAYLGL